MSDTIPEKGIIFWPVGNGDSTTIKVDKETFIQIDIHHTVASENEDDPKYPVVDELKKILPKEDGKPYLSTFVLTHHDEDHIQGFTKLLEEVTIGEIWFTPRIFWEKKKDLIDEAKIFWDEAKRRVSKVIKERRVGAGDRVRIIGYADVLKEKEDYKGFPDDLITVPGNEITEIDGEDKKEIFRAFIHAPFKDESEKERNDTSVGMQIRLKENNNQLDALIFGDLCYEPLKRVFDYSKDDTVSWDILLAPHHCSKKVMYVMEDDKEVRKDDIMEDFEKNAKLNNFIIASSEPVPIKNKSGENPPHAKAKHRYQEITQNFVCTMEYPGSNKTEPIIFELNENGINYPDGYENQNDKSRDRVAALAGLERGKQDERTERRFGNID